jgi:hypothetical protein
MRTEIPRKKKALTQSSEMPPTCNARQAGAEMIILTFNHRKKNDFEPVGVEVILSTK